MNRSEAMKAMWAKKKANGTLKNKKKRKVKGAWSKKAKERQSIRLKAYHKGKTEASKIDVPVEQGSIKAMLVSLQDKMIQVAIEVEALAKQLG